MCGRYTLTAPEPGAIRARFRVGDAVPVTPRFNIAPGDEVLTVTTDREGRPRGELLRWGLVPSWAKSPATGLKMINARIETAADRPAFRTALARFRCLIIADGFYEWRALPGIGKQPFHITRHNREPFAFAGLWSIWHALDGGTLRTCTILTTAPNEKIAPLHDRMPIILPPAAEAAWLDLATPASALRELASGLSAAETALARVGPAVNDARYDGPECLAPPPPVAQGALF